MRLFNEQEMQRIRKELNGQSKNILITFRNRYGPTKLERLWLEMLKEFNITGKCINWWSSSGTIGLLECETSTGLTIFGQWMLYDTTELLGIFHLDDEEVVNIKEGFDAGNVASFAMRAIRIGETGED